MKKIIITIVSITLILLISITSYAWYIDKSNVGYIRSSDINLNINGYYSYTDSYNNVKQEWTNLDDTKTKIQIEFDYSLNFAFVVTNNSDKDIDLSIRLSDFSSYIFNSFKGESTIDNDDLNTINENISKYNTKFFLAIDTLKYKTVESSSYEPNSYDSASKDLKNVELNQDSNYECSDTTNFLWRYSYNNMLNKNKITIKKYETTAFYITLKNSQSQVSLKEDYTKWLYSYGSSYIKNNTTYTDEDVMKKYLEAYYNLERKSLYEDQDGASILKNTNLCIDYFEFIADL